MAVHPADALEKNTVGDKPEWRPTVIFLRVNPVKLFLVSIGWLFVVAANFATAGETFSAANQAGPGKFQSRPVTDYASLIDSLRARAVNVEPEGEVDQPFLSVTGKMIKLHGEDVQVFQYPNAAAMENQAARISRDGSAVGRTKIHWMGPPHFYKQGRLLVLYLGDEKKVIQTLEDVLGRQFAGQ
jgi:hypothetical protein